jgi:pimeloyl-ACP methyl ester carboxylesterase
MPTIELNDLSLHYERTGHGPPMLFIHGMCGGAWSWAEQVPMLAAHHTCVSYDRRGHTRSTRGRATVSPGVHADDAAALIEALDLAPCLVVGSSSGAVIGIDLALRHHRLLRGIVLSEPPLFSLDPAAGRVFRDELMPRVDDAVDRGGLRSGVEAFWSFVCAEAWSSMDEDRRNRLRDNAETGFADLRSPPLEVAPADLASVTVPALVIAGTTSHRAFRSVARRLAAGLPDARLVEIDGGHVPYVEHPDPFARAVSLFAAELDRRAAVTP